MRLFLVVDVKRGEGVLAATEREAIRQALAAFQGNITHAAQTLGIQRQTLQRKMTKHGLR